MAHIVEAYSDWDLRSLEAGPTAWVLCRELLSSFCSVGECNENIYLSEMCQSNIRTNAGPKASQHDIVIVIYIIC